MQPFTAFSVSSARYKANMETQDPFVSNLNPVRFYQNSEQSFIGPLILCSTLILH